ncbi:hypothetical protein BKA69DRAFT_665394 [Paraphysoderma sedebokerense]|nr:hypothetical protein BKA69DRAFT_665394 [Paraphysoderma sedebokerense]
MLSLPGPPFVEPGTLAYHEFEFDLKRSQLTQFFAIFVVILNWLLSLIMGFFAVQVLLKNRKVEPGALVPPCALLFALPSLRNVQPSAPPVGATTDILGFFWNMAIVAVSAMVVILSFILRWKAENHPTESPHMHPQSHRNSTSTSYNPKRFSGASFNALPTPPLGPTNFDSENTLPSDFVAPRSVSLTVQSEDSIHRGRSGSRHPPVMGLFDGGNNGNHEDVGGLHESPERIALQPQHPHRHFRVI